MDRVLQVASISDSLNNALKDQFNTVRLWEQEDPEAFINENADAFDVLVTNASTGADASLQARFPNLMSCYRHTRPAVRMKHVRR